MKIFYISDENDLDGRFSPDIKEIFFFSYSRYLKKDDIISMWQKIFLFCHEKQPEFIILKFKAKDMMNDHEYDQLCKFGVVLNLTDEQFQNNPA